MVDDPGFLEGQVAVNNRMGSTTLKLQMGGVRLFLFFLSVFLSLSQSFSRPSLSISLSRSVSFSVSFSVSLCLGLCLGLSRSRCSFFFFFFLSGVFLSLLACPGVLMILPAAGLFSLIFGKADTATKSSVLFLPALGLFATRR